MDPSASARAIIHLRKDAAEYRRLAKESEEAAERIEKACPPSIEYIKAIPVKTERTILPFSGDAGKANGPYFRCGIETYHGQTDLVVFCPTFLRRSLTVHVDGEIVGASY